MIREILLAHNAAANDRRTGDREADALVRGARLAVSDIGQCPRRAFYHAYAAFPAHPFHAEVTHPFDPYVVEVLEAGHMYEAATSRALRAHYGERLSEQAPLETHIWRGHPDFVIDNEVVVDNKGTNPLNFQVKGRLPYLHNCLQVLMYADLLRRTQTTRAKWRGRVGISQTDVRGGKPGVECREDSVVPLHSRIPSRGP